MKRTSIRSMSGATALCLSMAASPVLAQSATGAGTTAQADSASDTSVLQDIIVTATRFATDLQKTPIAVSAFDSLALKERGITTAIDLNGAAPNVSIGGRSGSGATQGAVTIRGIGVDANDPSSPGVGLYVDGVYIASSYGNLLGTYDLGQLEILRGPQGTLFGRNTIGGAIQYNTVKPKLDDFNAFIEGTLGNQNHHDVAAGVNIPIASWAAVRLSGAKTDRDGYIHDLLNDVYRGSEHNSDLRAQLLLRPVDNLQIDLKAEQVRQKSNGPSAIQSYFDPTAAFYSPAMQAFISPDNYTTYGYNSPNYFHSRIRLAQGTIAYGLTPDIQLKSISAYSKTDDVLVTDGDETPLNVFALTHGSADTKLFTQELQANGTALQGRLHFTLGAYYFDQKYRNLGGGASIFGGPFVNQFGNYSLTTHSYAGYGQATYDLTDRLSVVGGIRYTTEKENLTSDSPFFVSPSRAKFNNTSPLAGVNFKVTPTILLYGKWSRGFRAGSYSPNQFAANFYGPETASTFEAGARMQFFGNRVRINPTIFTTKQTNIQFNATKLYNPAPGVFAPLPIVQNAGDARTKGLEVESQFAVTDRLTLTANGALFEGHYTSVLPGIGVTLDSALKRAPKSSFALGGNYAVPLGEGKITLSSNYVWQADQRSATKDGEFVTIKAYGLLNARLAYTAPQDRYSIALFANNLTNKYYLISGTEFGKGGGIAATELDVGRPREFGVTVRFNIGH